MIELEELLGSGLGDDMTGIKQDDTRSEEQSFADVVGDDDDGLGETARDGEKGALQFGAGDGIKGAKRFVHQENGGIDGEGAGYTDTLALATGEFAGKTRCELGRVKINEAHDFGIAGSDAVGGPALETGDQAYVLRYRQMGKETDFLNDIADAAAKQDGIPIEDALRFDAQGASSERAQAIDEFEEGGLAAAAATQESDCFSLMNVERNRGENGKRRNSRNLVCNVLEIDDRVCHVGRFSPVLVAGNG